MSGPAAVAISPAPVPAPLPHGRNFLGLMIRDVLVLQQNLIGFVLGTIVNPLLFVLVFVYIFPHIGQRFIGPAGQSDFATVLLPGLMAVAILFQGISGVTLPLTMELNRTGELGDRLLAPLPTIMLPAEKVLFSTCQSIVAAALVFPIAYFLPAHSAVITTINWGFLLATPLLGGLASGSLGLLLGTVVRPQHIQLLFSVLLTPLIFLGCVYYPWRTLGSVPWLQWIVLINPLTYISEGLRIALTPGIPAMPAVVPLLVLAGMTVAFGLPGARGFVRRVTA
jgi:ABC-2 type transport system permease protein